MLHISVIEHQTEHVTVCLGIYLSKKNTYTTTNSKTKKEFNFSVCYKHKSHELPMDTSLIKYVHSFHVCINIHEKIDPNRCSIALNT